jgi:hypothetical protein
MLSLPSVKEVGLRNEADYYGASYCIAKQLGYWSVPKIECKGWTHGWTPVDESINRPEYFIYHGLGSDYFSDDVFFVQNQFVEQLLRRRGFNNSFAIGMPIIYAGDSQVPIKRRSGSLLLMPSANCSNDLDRSELIQKIKDSRGRFAEVYVSVHWSSYLADKKKLESLGYNVICGPKISDKNGLERARRVFQYFDYVVSDGFGSHLVYANYFGCKVCIPFSYKTCSIDDCVRELEKTNYPKDLYEVFYQRSSKNYLEKKAGFLFQDIFKSISNKEWADNELGVPFKKSPVELARLFGWKR